MRTIGIADASASSVAEQFLGVGINDICRKIEERTGSPCPADFIYRVETRTIESYKSGLRRIPDLDHLLDTLADQGFEIAIATGASTRRLRATLRISGLDAVFDGKTANVDEVAFGKPAPDVFLLAAQKIGVAAGNCIAIEDSPHGIEAAKAAGMWPIGFVGGSHLADSRANHAETLTRAGALHVLDSLLDLPRVLENIVADPSFDGSSQFSGGQRKGGEK